MSATARCFWRATSRAGLPASCCRSMPAPRPERQTSRRRRLNCLRGRRAHRHDCAAKDLNTEFQPPNRLTTTEEPTMHLQGKSAIVTGGGRSIGRDVALLLAKEGASVIVNDPGVGRGGEATAERPADDVVAEIKKAGGKAVANYDSVSDYQKAGAMVRQCVETFGKVDILV